MDDAQILKGLNRNDREAFAQMHEKYYKQMLSYAHYILKDDEEALEATQEVFFKLLHVKSWKNVRSVRGYAYRTLHNYCVNLVNDRRRMEQKKMDYAMLTYEDVWIDLDRHHEKYCQDRIDQLVALLSPQRRTAFNLVHEEGKSYSEAAALMGISRNSLKTHLKLGMKVMRKFGWFMLFVISCI